MKDIEKLEEIMKMMVKYRVISCKVGDIAIDGLQLPIQEDDLKESKTEEVDEDLLMWSAN